MSDQRRVCMSAHPLRACWCTPALALPGVIMLHRSTGRDAPVRAPDRGPGCPPGHVTGLICHPSEGRTGRVNALRSHDIAQAAKCLVVMVRTGKKQTRYALTVVPGGDLSGETARFRPRKSQVMRSV